MSNINLKLIIYGGRIMQIQEGTYKELVEKISDIEKEIEKYWIQKDIIRKSLERKGKKFYFLDGPPYVTGSIHIGTAWNKILKDAILRYKRMSGYSVWSIPGYDTHGLPIETAVEKILEIKNKKEIVEMGINKFNMKCKELVEKNIEVQTNQFKNLGIWMNWDKYYATYKDTYISRIWFAIKKAYEKGLLGEDRKVFYWCPRCQTVLSEHEVALGYKEKISPSIFVKFPLVREEKTYLLIWTTTPWTLPSNTGVMAHPEMKYVLIKLQNGDKMVIMKNRLSDVIKEEYVVLEEFYGKDIEGWQYENPLKTVVDAQKELRDGRKVVLSSEYVSSEEGTGLVHMAPSHGKEDFEVSKKYNLPIIDIVNNEGKFTEKAGKYKGLFVFDANEKIIEDLKKMGMIYKESKILHKYPHCWRCHSPLILRTTKQWVLYLSKLRDQMIEENEKIHWIPSWAGEERFGKWLETARDWVISRQRYWGTPAPIWRCEKCGYIKVIGSKEELTEKGFNVNDLHRPYIDEITFKCPKCGGVMRRVPDVLDVWLDSGAASWASIGYPDNRKMFDKLWPVDFIVEGNDQTRGWFYSLLALGIVVFGETPYKNVLMHGYALDENGRPMSKSLGNVILPEEILKKYSIDILRVFILTHPPWEDLRVSFKKLDAVLRILNILFNTFEFFDIYADLDRYMWQENIITQKLEEFPEEDRWIISIFELKYKEINENMRKYYIHIALKELLDFVVNHLSREYIKLIRRRVWVEENKWEKEATYHSLFYILRKITIALAPFLPYISEYFYLNILKKYREEREDSVHLIDWPDVKKDLINKNLIESYKVLWDLIGVLDSIRHSSGIKKRQPLKEVVIPKELYLMLSPRQIEIIKEQINVQNVLSYEERDVKKYIRIKGKAIIKNLGPLFKKNMMYVKNIIENLDEEYLWKLMKTKEIVVDTDILGRIKLTNDLIELDFDSRQPYKSAIYNRKRIFLDTQVNTELMLMGIARDIIRRIQVMRKEMNLSITDKIDVYIYSKEKDIVESVSKYKDIISNEIRAIKIFINKKERKGNLLGSYSKKWIINDLDVNIKIIKR